MFLLLLEYHHFLLTSFKFVRCAEKKLNVCLTYSSEMEPPIREILGQGVDPVFDRAISLLGDTARRNPKPVIDTVMFWRKTKSEAAVQASATLNHSLTAHRRTGSRADFVDLNTNNQIEMLRNEEIEAERKCLISIFILCRVLKEIVTKTPLEILGEDLSSKLEEIVFKQLRATDPSIFSNSTIRAANWELFAELLGKMSSSRFMHVGDEFIAELEKHTGLITREKESNVQLIIHGMRYLNIQLYPMNLLEDCADFLISLTKFFRLSQNPKIKIAYAEVFIQILLPVAGMATAELNYPTWTKAIQELYKPAHDLAIKPKFWNQGFPLLVTLLCVSPQEFFASRWAPLLESNYSKLKDKNVRSIMIVSITRLLWVFLCRFTESLNNTTKKLDLICKPLLAPASKKLWAYVDSSFSTTFSYLIRIIGRGYLQYALENIFFQLILPGPNTTADGANFFSLESVAHDRAIIGIRSYLFILSDLDEGHRPEFPTDSVLENVPVYPTININSSSSVNSHNSLKQFHEEFGRMLGRMVQLCDTQLGFHASVSEEKLLTTAPIKPQMTFHFGSENNLQNQRQGHLEFFGVVLEAIPWCVPPNISMPKLVEMLSRNAVNPDSNIANISARVLKSLVRVKDPKTIVPIVAKYLFTVDSKIFSTYTTSFSSHSDFKVLINLYIELLQIWIDTVRVKISSNEENNGEDLKLNNLWTIIEEAEGNGLFFICSQDRTIRQSAIKILRLTADFENVILGESNEASESSFENNERKSASSISSRLIHLFETTDPLLVFKSSNPRINLSGPERRRLHKLHGMKKEGLVRLAESDYGVDTALWLKMFPLVMRLCFETYPIPVALCRNIICGKLVQMHEAVLEFSRSQPVGSTSAFQLKHPMRTHPEIVVEQWRIYLIVASTTLTQTEEQKLHVPENPTQHGRKKSVQKVTIHHQKITSARSVFRMVIPLFGVEHPIIRDAIVTSLSSVNINIYRTLIECLQPAIYGWKDELKTYNRRDVLIKDKLERVATEVTHVLSSTAHYLKDKTVYEDEWIISKLLSFLTELKKFLGRPETQTDPNYQRLRCYFASFLESFYTGVKKSSTSSDIFSYNMRVEYFVFIEEWCGCGKNWSLCKDREDTMRRIVLGRNSSRHDEGLILAALEFEKNALQRTVLSAMASLCYGPVDTNNPSDFSLPVLLSWIESVFQSSKENTNEVGRRALKNLLETNTEDIVIFKEAIANCYRHHLDHTNSQSYFTAVAEVILLLEEYPCQVWQLLALGLFKTGDSNVEVRKLAAKLLKAVESKSYDTACVREYEGSLFNNTPAVYKRVMFNLSSRFAKDHPKEAFMIFSELTMFFHQVDDFSRRDILAVLLPWVQTIELQMEPNGTSPSPPAVMVMSNLFEITVVFSDKIQNEVEALWVALGNGLYPGNVKAVLDFIMHHSLERRDPEFVEHARKILVYLSTTPAGLNLADALMAYLQPKAMIPQHPSPLDISIAASQFPYVANLSTLLEPNFKEAGFSHGQLAVILLVDLPNRGHDCIRSNFPLILHVCYVLLDHYLPLVQNQAREMLIRVIHELGPNSTATDELIELLRKKDQKSAWSYYNLNSDKNGACTPKPMDQTIQEILSLFSSSMPELKEQWATIALSWATTCPVRHIACRSFQIFRCLLYFVDATMLGDMLARLSNTIADVTPDIQGFAMQILMTLNAITTQLDTEELLKCPQLFWAAVASLETTSEKEFVEVLSLLSKYISKIDLNSAATVECLASVFPPKWSGKFEGLQGCVIAGLRSSTSYEPTIRFLDKLNLLESNEMVAGSDRLCISILATLPRFLHALEISDVNADIIEVAEQLSVLCEVENRSNLARIFTSLAKNRFRSKKDFLGQTVQAIRSNFFPFYDGKSIKFLLGLLFNKIPWIKEESMEILQEILPYVDLKKEEFNGIGADLIMPLLRLLQTDYAEKALSVLDQVANISVGTLDKYVLRVSLGDKAIKKEYESAGTLFGIPDDNGWSIPMPEATAVRCRNNVHSVFYTCSLSSSDEPSIIAEEFQFHRDEFMLPSTFPDPVDNFSIAEGEAEGTLSNMWAELENLDSFFVEAMGSSHTRNVSFTDTETSNDMIIDPVDSAPQIYDKKVSLILNRSLARTPSSTSFKTSLADSFSNNMATQSTDLRAYSNVYRSRKNNSQEKYSTVTSRDGANDNFFFSDDEGGINTSGESASKFPNVSEEPDVKGKSKYSKGKKDALKDAASHKKQMEKSLKAHTDTPAEKQSSSFLRANHDSSASSKSQSDEIKSGSGESLFKLENLLRATNIGKSKKKDEKKKKYAAADAVGPSSFIGGHQMLGSGVGISSSSLSDHRNMSRMSSFSKAGSNHQLNDRLLSSETNKSPKEWPNVSSPPRLNHSKSKEQEMSQRSFQFPPPNY